jgi:hypothetical protein
METPGRTLGLAALCVATLLTMAEPLQAQDIQPRSTTNPYGGLRGNSTRGLATRGASSRSISGRTTARPMAPVVAVEPTKTTGTGPTPPASTPAPLPPGRRAQPQPAAAKPRAAASRIRPRLITLKGRKVLRGRSHLSNGLWNIQTRDGWRTVPEGDVLRTDLESDVLAGIRKRRRTTDRQDPVARLNEARWMLDLGLASEALGELDELLERADSEHGAVELLSRDDLSRFVSRPDETLDDVRAMEHLLDFAARSTPSIQELVILELVPFGARHRNELERLLQDRHDALDSQQRVFGARALRRLFPARSVVR